METTCESSEVYTDQSLALQAALIWRTYVLRLLEQAQEKEEQEEV
jgi:hypothetical protein